jgi:DNA polymerase III subunit chi
MTTAVQFHILPGSDLSVLERYVCSRLSEWVSAGRTICVVAEDSAAADRLDGLLWTFSEQAFVPHEVATDREQVPGKAPLPSVLITVGHSAAADILVNLAVGVPTGFDAFNQVVEFVDADPSRRDAGRRRFVVYRERGFPPETLKVGS